MVETLKTLYTTHLPATPQSEVPGPRVVFRVLDTPGQGELHTRRKQSQQRWSQINIHLWLPTVPDLSFARYAL